MGPDVEQLDGRFTAHDLFSAVDSRDPDCEACRMMIELVDGA